MRSGTNLTDSDRREWGTPDLTSADLPKFSMLQEKPICFFSFFHDIVLGKLQNYSFLINVNVSVALKQGITFKFKFHEVGSIHLSSAFERKIRKRTQNCQHGGSKNLTLSFGDLVGVEKFLTNSDRRGGDVRSLISKSDVFCECPLN